jgi:DMSO/TMAO reductase YedYZ molybdopterin-dependent catalytic subunit
MPARGTHEIVETHDVEVVRSEPLNAEASARSLHAELTPDGAHFVRSHFREPMLDAERHRIRIGGAVATAGEWSVAALRGLETRTMKVTLECAGNGRLGMSPLPRGEPWSLGAVSTAAWTGVPLRTVLEHATPRDDVCEVLVAGADSGLPEGESSPIAFERSLPLEKALDPDTLLAYEMNGRPLPFHHGAPVRLLVPRWYGVASVKWVSRIEALTRPYQGFYQSRRYVYEDASGITPAPVATMRVRSLIVDPEEHARVPRGSIVVRGWAWSGSAPVVSVDVELDGGDDWAPASLGPMETHAWRSFQSVRTVAGPGRHVLRSRARDGAGNVQPEHAPWNRLGYGNDAIAVRVFAVT